MVLCDHARMIAGLYGTPKPAKVGMMMDEDEMQSGANFPAARGAAAGSPARDGEGEQVMTTTGDADYFRGRAEWHDHRASVTTDVSASMLHRTFASLYAARADALPADKY